MTRKKEKRKIHYLQCFLFHFILFSCSWICSLFKRRENEKDKNKKREKEKKRRKEEEKNTKEYIIHFLVLLSFIFRSPKVSYLESNQKESKRNSTQILSLSARGTFGMISRFESQMSVFNLFARKNKKNVISYFLFK